MIGRNGGCTEKASNDVPRKGMMEGMEGRSDGSDGWNFLVF